MLEPGEQALDVGANIGQMTSLMWRRVGRTGRVFAFEPHPELFEELEFNVGRLLWSEGQENRNRLVLLNVALSDRDGEAFLKISPDWHRNRGLARVVDKDSAGDTGTMAVRRLTADGLLMREGNFALCKIDVEGHEGAVLSGAGELLESRRIRDIIFEDMNPHPSVLQDVLCGYGYKVFSVATSVYGPVMEPASKPFSRKGPRDGHNFIASLEPERLLAKTRNRGWMVLRKS
jgi:FkbM family methyltransferase